MMTTILHLMRKNGAITDVDASACYDRMLPALIWLGYFKAGATWNIVQLFALALLNLKYFIVTAFGISLLANQHSDLSQFLGPGQGAADAPFAWALISTYLICAYNKQAHGCQLKDPTCTIAWKRAIDMFVDDSYLFHSLARWIGAIALSWHSLRTIYRNGLNFCGQVEERLTSPRASTLWSYGHLQRTTLLRSH
eukprot:scaffold61404_cov38-Attheya_sp.AAC.3